jgi:thiamine biosynthesis lipoprotein
MNKSRFCPGFALAALSAALLGCASTQPLQRCEFTRLCMGVQTRVVVYAPNEGTASRGAAAAFDEIARLDAMMSDYRPDSELMRLCSHADGGFHPVSPELLDVLASAEQVSRKSGGAFDVTVGPATLLWRESRKSGLLPAPERLGAALDLIDWRLVELLPRDGAVALKKPGMRLDLGGIAKCYAADRALSVLRSENLPTCLVALAGDIAAGDAPPGTDGWRIAVAGEKSGAPIGTLTVHNTCVSTSGDTEQFIEIGGRRYSHIIDPRTGLGTEGRRVVTVVAPSGAIADSLATAACVVSPDQIEPLIRAFPGVAAIVTARTPLGLESARIDPDAALRWQEVRTPR